MSMKLLLYIIFFMVLMYALNASAGGIADAYLGSQPEFNYLDEQEQRSRARKIVAEEDRRVEKLPSRQQIQMDLRLAEKAVHLSEQAAQADEVYLMQEQMRQLQEQIDDLRR